MVAVVFEEEVHGERAERLTVLRSALYIALMIMLSFILILCTISSYLGLDSSQDSGKVSLLVWHEGTSHNNQRKNIFSKLLLSTTNNSDFVSRISVFCKTNGIRPCKRIFDTAFKIICNHQNSCNRASFCIRMFKDFYSTHDHERSGTNVSDGNGSFMTTPLYSVNNFVSRVNLSDCKLLLVVSHYQEDLSWLSTVSVDYPFILISKTIRQHTIFLDKNVGNEVTAYLVYIVQYYDTLPEFSLFLHGHNVDWHQFYGVHFILDNIKLSDGYQNINNIAFSPSWRSSKMDGLRNIWEKLFSKELGKMPTEFHDRCCAQFIVHRSRIRLRSKGFYEELLRYVQTDDPLSDDGYHSDMSFYMEYIWHYIFGEKAVTNCTSENQYSSFQVDSDHEFGKINYFL